jgi:hypothetical protein
MVRPSNGGAGRRMSIVSQEHDVQTRQGRQTKSPQRLSVNLSAEVAQALQHIQRAQGLTLTDTVRRVISIAAFIEEATSRGAKILVHEGKSTKEVIFPRF